MSNLATIRAAAAAAEALKDEDTRRTVLVLAIIPTILSFLFLLVCVFLLATPMLVLSGFFNADELSLIKSFRDENKGALTQTADDLTFNGQYPMPVAGTVTSGYGLRDNPTGIGTVFHKGIDIRGAWHSPIISIADGVVVKANTASSTYGNYIIIKHETEEGTFYSVYAHLSKLYVFEGQEVTQGTIIGLEGGEPHSDNNPGDSTGHHLHFEIRMTQDGNQVDPTSYLFQSEDSEHEQE